MTGYCLTFVTDIQSMPRHAGIRASTSTADLKPNSLILQQKRVWAHNPQLFSVLAIHRSSNSQCTIKMLGRLWLAYLKACIKFCLVRLSLKRTPLPFKSKFLSLWGTEVPWGLVWDWGTHIQKSEKLLQTSSPAVLSDVSAVLILLFFYDKYILTYALKTSMLWKKTHKSPEISPTPSQNKTEINNAKPLQNQNTPLHLLLKREWQNRCITEAIYVG